VLPLIEIKAAHAFYDYASKYTAGMYEHIVPALISQEITQAVKDVSRKVYRLMKCRSFARIDFMLDTEGRPWVIEVNTIPGCTETSLVPDAARAAGMDFDDLMAKIVGQEMPA
jgi:D-alanine-D-alanine ligase